MNIKELHDQSLKEGRRLEKITDGLDLLFQINAESPDPELETAASALARMGRRIANTIEQLDEQIQKLGPDIDMLPSVRSENHWRIQQVRQPDHQLLKET